MKFLLGGIKSKATAVKGELSSSEYPLKIWILRCVKAREEVFPILDKSFVKFQRNPVSSGEREGGSLTWRQLHSRAAPGVGMGEPAAPPAIDSRNWNRTRATHSQHSYCTAMISGGFDTVHRVPPSRVFLKNTFFRKKLGRYPHVPLWGLYKAYPRAFFSRTSLEGHTT